MRMGMGRMKGTEIYHYKNDKDIYQTEFSISASRYDPTKLTFVFNGHQFADAVMDAEEVGCLIKALQNWLESQAPEGPTQVVDDMTDENVYLPYVQRLNDALEMM